MHSQHALKPYKYILKSWNKFLISLSHYLRNVIIFHIQTSLPVHLYWSHEDWPGVIKVKGRGEYINMILQFWKLVISTPRSLNFGLANPHTSDFPSATEVEAVRNIYTQLQIQSLKAFVKFILIMIKVLIAFSVL